MYAGQTVFSQLMQFAPAHEFRKFVTRYRGNYKVKSFSCWDQFLCMAFAQLTYRESLRDIEACLRASGAKRYHMGIRSKVSRNTLANANEKRDWRIYADFAQVLIATARRLYAQERFGVRLKRTVYALDSTTIDLCLSLFPWATFQQRKGAVKLHTLLDLRGSIPTVVILTAGNVHDVNILDDVLFEAGAIYVLDRGYLDSSRLYRMTQASAFFITRARCNTQFQRLHSRPVDKTTGLQCDQTVVLTGEDSHLDYPEPLRRVRYRDPETQKRFVFLTNNFTLAPLTIARLYRARWRVELFFKWIKQHLRIKAFYGTSENAVKTQVWIAISVYVLVAIAKKRLQIEHSLYTMLQILSLTLFEKTPILQAFSSDQDYNVDTENSNQLILFE
jgi:hypothetical protein